MNDAHNWLSSNGTFHDDLAPAWDAVFASNRSIIEHITGKNIHPAISLTDCIRALHAAAVSTGAPVYPAMLLAMFARYPEGAFAIRIGSDAFAADVEHIWRECIEALRQEKLNAAQEAIARANIFQWSEDAWDITMIPRRPWVGPPYIMRRQITIIHGPGGASKSLIIAHWAVALTLNRAFGRMTPRGPARFLLTNFEDDKDEQDRRLSAALECFTSTPGDLAGKLRRLSLGPVSDATMFCINAAGLLETTPAFDALIWHCETFRPDVVALDPLIAINAAPESDNSIMRRVMTILRTQIAHPFNCALIIVHHDTKGGGEDTASDQTNARGAGDIINAARFELAIKGMSGTQAEGFGIEREQRKHYFRVGSEDSKRNYAAPEAAE